MGRLAPPLNLAVKYVPRVTRALCLWVAVLIECAPVQQAPVQPVLPPFQPTVQHYVGVGCKGAHDTVYLPGVHINGYPGWPPTAQPEHIVLDYTNGSVIWGKPPMAPLSVRIA